MAEYAKFIAEKNVKLGSAGKLDEVRAALSKKGGCGCSCGCK
jgi:hypothetical protein